MPRRRMIDPSFWDDEYIGALNDTERVLIIGCFGNADDEGRLHGSGSYIRSAIWMHDDTKDNAQCGQLRDQVLEKMKSWPVNHPYRLIKYSNCNAEYLFVPMWQETNKPSHPAKSRLPAPPAETLPLFSTKPPEDVEKPSGVPPEDVEKPSGVPPSQVRLGQSSLGKVSIGKEDFTKFLSNEKDLTDFLTSTLEEYMPRGLTFAMQPLKELWLALTHTKMPSEVFQFIYESIQKYKDPPFDALAKSIVKGFKYCIGKRSSVKYLQKVFTEQMNGGK